MKDYLIAILMAIVIFFNAAMLSTFIAELCYSGFSSVCKKISIFFIIEFIILTIIVLGWCI